MPRAIVLGNGKMLVNYDGYLNIRDLYYPHVGLLNHLNGRVNGIGIWVDGQFSWIDESWELRLRYQYETLITDISATNPRLCIRLNINSCVHKDITLYIKQIEIENLADKPAEIRILFYHDFCLNESEIGDTACFDPGTEALIHYKRNTYLLINGCIEQDGKRDGIFQYTTGQQKSGQASWQQVQTGALDGRPIAQGHVDSALSLRTIVEPHSPVYASYWIAAGQCHDDVKAINDHVGERGIQKLFEETSTYWYSWVNKRLRSTDLFPTLVDLYRRSLLIIRTQIDEQGAVIAANDTDCLDFSRDHYSYLWPRDGAITAFALDTAGYQEVTARFFTFCRSLLTRAGYFLHKYDSDGNLGSSWHPWLVNGERQLPIQEDETGLIVHALWHHYERHGNLEFADHNYGSIIRPSADFMAAYRDPRTGLPQKSYDLWEERLGIHAFTVAAVHAGLVAAAKFAVLLGDPGSAETYNAAAAEIRTAFEKYFYDEDLGRFSTSLELEVRGNDISLRRDARIDSSLFGIAYFGLLSPDDMRVAATMDAVRQRLEVRRGIGGFARYENDYFRQVETQDTRTVPGNPWVVPTLWLAQWQIITAKSQEDLRAPLDLLDWVAQRASSAGLLAEQFHPDTGAPLSVSPLTWSHATFCLAVDEFLRKQEELSREARGMRRAAAWAREAVVAGAGAGPQGGAAGD